MSTSGVEFFFVGFGKCGTSWIYELLRRHDVVATPSIKEPYLVDVDAERRAALIAKLYRPKDDQPLADFSNVYYWDPQNANKIKAINPQAKIVITMRMPSERVVSHFGFLQRNALVPDTMTLADYLEGGDPEDIVARTNYAAAIARYETAFGAENVLVLPLEALREDPQGYADRLFAFLGVEGFALSEEDKLPVLQAAKPRSRMLARIAKGSAMTLRSLGFLSLLGGLKQMQGLRRLLYKPVDARPEQDFGAFAQQVAQMDTDYAKLLARWHNDP